MLEGIKHTCLPVKGTPTMPGNGITVCTPYSRRKKSKSMCGIKYVVCADSGFALGRQNENS